MVQRLKHTIEVGPYRLVGLVDQGEYATVYQAQHRVLETWHALKLMHANVDQQIVEAFLLEVRLHATIRHRHVVRATDAGAWNDRPFLVIDWLDGQDLGTFLDERDALSSALALPLFRQMVRGVHAIHRQNIVHRDLKPENFLLTRDGRHLLIKVADFGLAKRIEPGMEPEALGLSVEFKTLGTPEYMAPEQAGRAGLVGQVADMWSLGVILYEMLTTQVPFDGERAFDILLQSRLGKYEPLSTYNITDTKIIRLVSDLLTVDEEKRLQDCGELLTRLDSVIS